MGIAQAGHMVLSNWDAEGKKVATTERVAAVSDTRVGFWVTDIEAWRQRFAHSDVVTLQEAGRGGKPNIAEPLLEGRVLVLAEGPLFDEVRETIHAEHKLGAGLESAIDKVGELFGKKTTEGVVLINVVG